MMSSSLEAACSQMYIFYLSTCGILCLCVCCKRMKISNVLTVGPCGPIGPISPRSPLKDRNHINTFLVLSQCYSSISLTINSITFFFYFNIFTKHIHIHIFSLINRADICVGWTHLVPLLPFESLLSLQVQINHLFWLISSRILTQKSPSLKRFAFISLDKAGINS